MRHWHLIRDYPRITKETPDAIDDFLETAKVNLRALEKLGEPVTSNVILTDLFTSKSPSSTISKWHRTLADKKMPSYTHLIDFLNTWANSDQISVISNETKGASYQLPRQRQNLPRGQTFTTTNRTWVCPICQGHHEIRNCEVFKAKSTKKCFELVKKASPCTNCLGRGHSHTQCSAGSCRIYRQRHLTSLHHDQTQVSSQAFNVQSSSGCSSNGRFSKGRSPTGSPKPRYSHRSRRTTESTQKSPPPSPRSRRSPHHYESHSTRTNSTGANRSSNP
jgi:rubredoxin